MKLQSNTCILKNLLVYLFMKNKKLKRRLELSAKFLEMGQALMREGSESNYYCISQSGNFMILIGGLVMAEEDVYEFGQLCSMFSAKKLLDELQLGIGDLNESLKNKDSYDEIIKRINKFREDNGEPPSA